MEQHPSLYKPIEAHLGIFEGIQGVDTQAIVSFYNHISYEGIPFLRTEEYARSVAKFNCEFRQDVERLSFTLDDKILLRGVAYYPGYIDILNANALDFISNLLDRVGEGVDHVAKNTGRCETVEDRILLSQVLDYRKHFSLLLFTGLFKSMLEDPSIPSSVFDESYAFCESAIREYYQFIVCGKEPETGVRDTSRIVKAINPSVAYDSHRSLSRELDHPGRVLLYSSNLCGVVEEPYDFSVNPLNGSAEVGFAVRAISRMADKRVVEGLSFVRYSSHDERHGDIYDLSELIMNHVPRQLMRQIDAMRGKRVIIIDDNITRGHTLANIRRALETHCERVDVSVVEINREGLYRVLEKEGHERRRVLPTRELLDASVGEWRDQRRIMARIYELVKISLNDQKA